MTAISNQIDLTTQRTVGQILNEAVRIYARMPLLFIALAGIVIVPYGVVVAVLSQKTLSASTELVLALADLALVNPFIAALEMQAVLDLGEGLRPRLPSVIRRGVVVLPVVAAAQIVAGLLQLVSVAFLGVVGVLVAVFLAIRLAVAAPVAAMGNTNWPSAIRASARLTQGNMLRVFGLIAIEAALTSLAASLVGGHTRVTTTIIGVLLAVVAQSFGTLLINLLYFDLRARTSTPVA